MKIERIRLRNYRAVTEHEVRFTDGITIIEGVNEAGKTSLVEAIDLLLAYPDSSSDHRVVAIQPVHTGAAPEVEIDFSAGPYRFTYGKRWSRKRDAETWLSITQPESELIYGRAAHDRAKEILGRYADLDLWAALRVLQTEALDQPALGGKQGLMRALDTAAGLDRATDDQYNATLIECAKKERDLYFTPRKGGPKDDYAKAIKAVESAAAEVAARQETFDRVTAHIEEISRTEQNLRTLKEHDGSGAPVIVELEQQLRELEAVENKISTFEEAAKLARAEAGIADSAATTRQTLCDDARSATNTAEALADQAKRDEAEAADKRKSAEEAREAADHARDHEREAEARAARAAADRDHLRDLEELAGLESRRDKAATAAADIERAVRELAMIRIDAAALDELEKKYQELTKAQATLEAAAAVVEITALDGSRTLAIDVDGKSEPVAADGAFTRVLTDETTLTIDDFVRVRIRPGSNERHQHAKVDKLRASFEKLCDSVEVTGIDGARAALSRRRDIDEKLTGARATANVALDGQTIEVVTERICALRARTEQYRATRPGLLLPENATVASTLADQAHDELTARRSEANQAETLADAHRAAAEKADANARVAKQRVIDAQEQAQRLERNLAAARATASDLDLATRHTQARDAAAHAETAWKSAAGSFDAGLRDAVSLQLKNERDIKRRRDQEIQDCELKRAELNAKLSNDHDAKERLDQACAKLDDAEQHHDRIKRRAEAAELLYSTLRENRDAAQRAYVEPFRKKLEQFARIVFGEHLDLALDENLAVTHRTQQGARVPYSGLSGGAREQLALCARLACASLIDPNDGVPVIIDDALGYTDPDRLRRIGAVFTAAEGKSQIIVLTCTPDRYRGIGAAKVIELHRSTSHADPSRYPSRADSPAPAVVGAVAAVKDADKRLV